MKGTKLLTSVAALALVLSVGACSEETLPDPSEVIATDPTELVDKANTYGNYSVEIQLDFYSSTNTITYAEYEAAVAYMYGYGSDSEAYYKYLNLCYSEVYYNYSIIWDIFYDTDYVYVEAYEYYNNEYYLLYVDILVNVEDGLWEYYYDGEYWYYSTPDQYLLYYGASKWQDVYSSLFDAAKSGVAGHFEYYPSYDYYDFDDWTYSSYAGYEVSAASAEWYCDVGGEWLDGSYAYEYAYYYYTHYETVFSEEYQELISNYYYDALFYTDETDTNLCLGEEDMYFIVYDVGTTDVRETVDYYHEYFQDTLQGL